MDINKAIRKQNRSFKIFMLTICFIFFMNPIILYLSQIRNIILIIILGIIEILIITVASVAINNQRLDYHIKNDYIIIKSGFIKREKAIVFLESVCGIHVYKSNDDIKIIIFTTRKIPLKSCKALGEVKFKKNKDLYNLVDRMVRKNKEKIYFYTVRTGGYKKYLLLEYLYKNCIHSIVSSSAIEEIKQCREEY